MNRTVEFLQCILHLVRKVKKKVKLQILWGNYINAIPEMITVAYIYIVVHIVMLFRQGKILSFS